MRETANKHCLLAVLLSVFAFNYVDRLALGLMLQDIKIDLRLSDTQLGVLGGIAFALFYSLMGLPIARWADRGDRALIISVTTALWSAAVALCGLARSFLQLLLIRVFVGVGEAGCMPPALSLITDTFSREERPRALATYMLGGPLSLVVGYFFAGWLNQLYGWRTTFVLLGLPGLGLAVLSWSLLADPRRGRIGAAPRSVSGEESSSDLSPDLREVGRALWRNATFRHLLFYFSAIYFFSYGISQWQPTFFVRSYGLHTGALGGWMAAIYGVGGLLGTYLGGEWAFRYGARKEGLQLRAMAILYACFTGLSAFVYLSHSLYATFAIIGVMAVGSALFAGPLWAIIQTLVPERMRAVSVAVIYLFANLIGMGLGPLAVGLISDAYRRLAGEESLRYSLLTLSVGYLWCAYHLWHGSRTVTRDLSVTRDAGPTSVAAAT